MRSSLFLHYILSDGILQAVLEIHTDLSECTELFPECARCYAIITMESLYDIVKECLSNSMADAADDEDDEEEYDNRRNLVGVNDEDEEEAPKKTSSMFKKSGGIKKRQPVENSAKALFRKKSDD